MPGCIAQNRPCDGAVGKVATNAGGDHRFLFVLNGPFFPPPPPLSPYRAKRLEQNSPGCMGKAGSWTKGQKNKNSTIYSKHEGEGGGRAERCAAWRDTAVSTQGSKPEN